MRPGRYAAGRTQPRGTPPEGLRGGSGAVGGGQTPVRLALTAFLVAVLSGCSVFEVQDRIADRARVVVTGATPLPLELVTSTKFEHRFLPDGGTQTTLFQSDTFRLSLDRGRFDREFQVKPDIGFHVRLTNHDTLPATASLQVYFDGRLAYDQKNVTLRDASLEFTKLFLNESYVR